MSHENVELVRGIYGPWGREAYRSWLSTWDEFRVEPEEFRELDVERVLVLSHFSGRGKTSRVDVGQVGTRGAELFHVRGGKVTKLVIWGAREHAFADLGLSDSWPPRQPS